MPTPPVRLLLDRILEAARSRGLDQRELAQRAGLSMGTLSRLKKQDDAAFSTLSRLATAVGLRLTLAPDDDYAADVERGELF